MTTTDRLDIDAIRGQLIDYQDALSRIVAVFAALIMTAKAQAEQGYAITHLATQKVIELLSISIA
jgi:hypothetical protein